MGEVKGIEIYAYDAAKKVYTFNSFDSIGMMGSGTMAVEGNTWTATGTSTMDATVWRDRCTLEFGTVGSTLMVKREMSTDGGVDPDVRRNGDEEVDRRRTCLRAAFAALDALVSALER